MVLKAQQKYVTDLMNAGATFLGVEDDGPAGHTIVLTVSYPLTASSVRKVYGDGSWEIGRESVEEWMDKTYGKGRWTR